MNFSENMVVFIYIYFVYIYKNTSNHHGMVTPAYESFSVVHTGGSMFVHCVQSKFIQLSPCSIAFNVYYNWLTISNG